VEGLFQSAAAVSCAADTAENVLATITVPAGAMGPNGTIRVWTSWSYTNGANNKVLRVRFGGGAGTSYLGFTATTTAGARFFTEISNRNATNSQFGGIGASGSFGASTNTYSTSAVDTTAATTIVISGTKASAGDTLTLERYLVELLPGD
jgi:hypothetical protein